MPDLRLRWLLPAIAFACAAPAGTQAPPSPLPPGDADDSETFDWTVNRTDRMTVPISIGASGPYRFIVDTGSERTVVSRELAQRLQLGSGPNVILHSMADVSRVRTALVPILRVGRRTVSNIEAPVLSQHTLGADGLLGVDSLASQRVDLDFRNNRMTVHPSRRHATPALSRADRDTIVVTAQSRFGRLILVDASIEGERVWVIMDTGAQVSIGNEALRRRLERRNRLGLVSPLQIFSVTGASMMVDYSIARRMRIGGVEITDMPVGFADAQPFRKLDLLDRPAVLLGMDALQLFEHVSLDFTNRQVTLRLASDGRR